MDRTEIIQEYKYELECEEMKKYYEAETQKIEDIIEEYAYRVFYNKISLVDSNEFFMDYTHQLREYMENKEDFKNFHIHYNEKETELQNRRKLTVFSQVEFENRFNEVQCYFAKSLSEFTNIISRIKTIKNHKSIYRGHSNWIYDLVPGIYRKNNENLLKNESKIIREFISANPKFFEGCESALDYLAVLQHHGFPTRLLDFTENPLVALYMACSGNEDKHGDVIQVDLCEEYYKYYDSDTVSLLTNLSFFDDDFDVSDFDYDNYQELFKSSKSKFFYFYGICNNEPKRKDMIQSFNDYPNIKRLVHRIRNEKPYYENKIDPLHLDNMIVIVKPRQNFDRLTRQNGLFAVFGIDRKKSQCAVFESSNLEFKTTHIIIPDECKSQILKELDKLQINKGTLYGDMDSIVQDFLRKEQKNDTE